MKILGIESAGKVASVALVEDGQVLCDFTINGKYTHSKTIMPMLESIKKITEVDLTTVDAIAVSAGPGSYTGLRIGASTAKGLAQVWQVPIIGVSTLESLAYNVSDMDLLICPMLDARRQHAYCAAYRNTEDGLDTVMPIELRSVETFVKGIKDIGMKALFLGDGLSNHRKLVEIHMGERTWCEARAQEALPKASTLALVAEEKYRRGETDSYLTHHPNYYRPSQAEREMNIRC